MIREFCFGVIVCAGISMGLQPVAAQASAETEFERLEELSGAGAWEPPAGTEDVKVWRRQEMVRIVRSELPYYQANPGDGLAQPQGKDEIEMAWAKGLVHMTLAFIDKYPDHPLHWDAVYAASSQVRVFVDAANDWRLKLERAGAKADPKQLSKLDKDSQEFYASQVYRRAADLTDQALKASDIDPTLYAYIASNRVLRVTAAVASNEISKEQGLTEIAAYLSEVEKRFPQGVAKDAPKRRGWMSADGAYYEIAGPYLAFVEKLRTQDEYLAQMKRVSTAGFHYATEYYKPALRSYQQQLRRQRDEQRPQQGGGAAAQSLSDLVAFDAVWKYRDDGSDQGTAWREPEFNDEAWSAGPAQLGYAYGELKTTVNSGPDKKNRFITTYFRHAFNVSDPASYRRYKQLALTTTCGEGCVVYLNGQEVYRSNMPDGVIEFMTKADSIASFREKNLYAGADPGLLRKGRNVIAVEMHQKRSKYDGFAFSLHLAGNDMPPAEPVSPPVLNPPFLVAQRSTWKYLDNGSDQGVDWRKPEFNDASWKQGPAKLGYGDYNEKTEVSFGTNHRDKFITTYFRHAFDVADPARLGDRQQQQLGLATLCDDGCIIYLNGKEVQRINLPEGPVDYKTTAKVAIDGKLERQFNLGSFDSSLLRKGRNVIAVEVHQQRPNSSDIGFDLELSGSAPPAAGAAGAASAAMTQ